MDLAAGKAAPPVGCPQMRQSVREWTDEEVYEQLANLAKKVDDQQVLGLADIEAVLFDPRFPERLEAHARELLKKLTKPHQPI